MGTTTQHLQRRFFWVLIFVSAFLTPRELSANPPYSLEYAREQVNEYISLFESFANAPSKRDGGKTQSEIMMRFTNMTHSTHFNDLFDAEELSPNPPIGRYLGHIAEKYNYRLFVNFEPLGEEREEQINGKKYASFKLRKTISYQGKTKISINIVKVDLEKGKIDQVLPETFSNGCDNYIQQGDEKFASKAYIEAAELYTAAKACPRQSYVHEQILLCHRLAAERDELEMILANGNQFFKRANYIEAKKYYEKALMVDNRDSYTISRIKSCDEHISPSENLSIYISLGDEHLGEGHYFQAKQYFQKARKYGSNTHLDKRITHCEEGIAKNNYEKQISFGDRHLHSMQFEKAKVSYEQALEYLPNDSYAINKIEDCILGSYSQKYYEEGLSFFENAQYKDAMKSFEKSKEFISSEKTTQMITRCENELNCKYYIKEANQFYSEKFYVKAKQLYMEAYKIRPNDMSLASRISRCETASKQMIDQELKDAVNYWNKDKYFRCFELLYKNKDSGQLTKVHDYMLGVLLFENVKNIKGKMNSNGYNFNKENMKSIGGYHLYKSAKAGYENAIYKYCSLRQQTIQALKLTVDCATLYNNAFPEQQNRPVSTNTRNSNSRYQNGVYYQNRVYTPPSYQQRNTGNSRQQRTAPSRQQNSNTRTNRNTSTPTYQRKRNSAPRYQNRNSNTYQNTKVLPGTKPVQQNGTKTYRYKRRN